MQPRLSGKSLELKLRDADEAFDASTSSHKYFVLQTRMQEATQSETAWSTPSNSLLLILLELQKDDELATAMRLKLSRGTLKARDTADQKVDPLGLLRCQNLAYVLLDGAVQGEIIKICHDDLVAGYYG